MTPEHEWARMCEAPLADDSGVPANLKPANQPCPSLTRAEAIAYHRKLYELFIGCAKLDDVSDRAKVMAYEMATVHAEELGLLGVSPYPLRSDVN